MYLSLSIYIYIYICIYVYLSLSIYIYIYIYIYIHTHTYVHKLSDSGNISLGGCELVVDLQARQTEAPFYDQLLHSCHILPFQPILRNIYFPPEPAKTAKHSPKSISEGGRIWQLCTIIN